MLRVITFPVGPDEGNASRRSAHCRWLDRSCMCMFPSVNKGQGEKRWDVHLVHDGVSTDKTSIIYLCSGNLNTADWIFRYESVRVMAESKGRCPYPAAHLHVNAAPNCYPGRGAFPDSTSADAPSVVGRDSLPSGHCA
jgi:hypothetical protein